MLLSIVFESLTYLGEANWKHNVQPFSDQVIFLGICVILFPLRLKVLENVIPLTYCASGTLVEPITIVFVQLLYDFSHPVPRPGAFPGPITMMRPLTSTTKMT